MLCQKEMEERVLSLMFRGYHKIILNRLNQLDFIHSDDNIFPQLYTREIFNRAREIFLSSNGLNKTLLADSFFNDSSIDVVNKEKYSTLINRFSVDFIEDESDSYVFSLLNRFVTLRKKRNIYDFANKFTDLLDKDDVDKIEKLIYDYANKSITSSNKIATIIDWKEDFGRRKKEILSDDSQSEGASLLTGFDPIDEISGGIKRGELFILLGRVGGGKSICKQHISGNVVAMGHRVLYYSKEDTAQEVAYRFDSFFSGIEHPKFHKKELTLKDVEIWEAAADKISIGQLRIACMGQNFTIKEVRIILNSQRANGFDPDFIVVDYIGLMSPAQGNYLSSFDWKAKMQVVQELKDFAVDSNIRLVTSAQIKPEAYEKSSITFEDTALTKLGVAANANVVIAILQPSFMRDMGQARIQILKGRSTGIPREFFIAEPNFDLITIDPRWRRV